MTKLAPTPAGTVLVGVAMSKNQQEILIERTEGRWRRRMAVMATRKDYYDLAEQLAAIGRPIVAGFETTGIPSHDGTAVADGALATSRTASWYLCVTRCFPR